MDNKFENSKKIHTLTEPKETAAAATRAPSKVWTKYGICSLSNVTNSIIAALSAWLYIILLFEENSLKILFWEKFRVLSVSEEIYLKSFDSYWIR